MVKFIASSLATILSITASCTTQSCNTIHSDSRFDTLPKVIDSTTFYFKTKPNLQDKVENALDTFVNQWYSKMLFAMKEPVLSNYQGAKEIYRFTWLRTFHHPASIRIEKQGDMIKLFTKVCSGAGGYKPGKIIFDTTIQITKDEFDLLVQKINAMTFWDLPTEIDDMGNDGAEWIIEAVKNNKYHIVTRWSPGNEQQGSIRSVGEYFISLSKISSEETNHFY